MPRKTQEVIQVYDGHGEPPAISDEQATAGEKITIAGIPVVLYRVKRMTHFWQFSNTKDGEPPLHVSVHFHQSETKSHSWDYYKFRGKQWDGWVCFAATTARKNIPKQVALLNPRVHSAAFTSGTNIHDSVELSFRCDEMKLVLPLKGGPKMVSL